MMGNTGKEQAIILTVVAIGACGFGAWQNSFGAGLFAFVVLFIAMAFAVSYEEKD